MLQFIKHLLILAFTIPVIASPLNAQDVDEDSLRKIVREELESLLEGDMLDVAIDKGIEMFILKQQALSEQANLKQQQAQAGNLRPVNEDDHIFGNPDAPITLVEYSDFECPFCKHFHPTVIQLIKNNPDRLRWVYRHFPLDFHNPGAQKQAEASECVAELNGNEAFWEYTHLIYQRTQSNGTGFPIENLLSLAEEIGVNSDAFGECMSSGRMTNRVNQDYENGVKIGVSGTPASVFTNQQGELRFAPGALPLNELQALLDELSQ